MKTTSGLLWIVILLVSVWGHGQHIYNGVTPAELSKASRDDFYVVPPNGIFIPFFFTNVGSWSVPRFEITLKTGFIMITWNDVFCAGDHFAAYLLSNTAGSLNATTNGRAPVGTPSCSPYTQDPLVADADVAYTRGEIVTNRPGVYNLTIVPIASPYSAGRAYVKVIYSPA